MNNFEHDLGVVSIYTVLEYVHRCERTDLLNDCSATKKTDHHCRRIFSGESSSRCLRVFASESCYPKVKFCFERFHYLLMVRRKCTRYYSVHVVVIRGVVCLRVAREPAAGSAAGSVVAAAAVPFSTTGGYSGGDTNIFRQNTIFRH